MGSSLCALLTKPVTQTGSVKYSRFWCMWQRSGHHLLLSTGMGGGGCRRLGQRQEATSWPDGLLTSPMSDHQQRLGQNGCPLCRLDAGLQGSPCPVN